MLSSIRDIAYRCWSGPLHVDVVGPVSLVEPARRLLEPYVVTELLPPVGSEAAGADPGAGWRVRAGIDDSATPRGFPVGVTSDGEPPTSLWCDGEGRELLLRTPADPEFMTQNLVRWTRTLLRLEHAARGGLFLHGGMVRHRGHGVAMLGDKRAGKTSTVLSLLRAGATFVSNDDLSLHPASPGWVGRGWPRSVSVRRDTFQALGIRLDEHLASRGMRLRHPANVTMAALLSADERRIGLTFLYPSEVCEFFGVDRAVETELNILVFPTFVSGEKAGLHRLSTTETTRRILHNILSPPAKHAAFLEPYIAAPRAAAIESAAARLAGRVPAFVLTQDFRALADGAGAIDNLLRKDLP